MELTKKNILVTGGTGFIGSHLVEALISQGYSVFTTYISINSRSYFISRKLDKKTVMINCDISSFEQVFQTVSRYKIDYIFHLAAQSLVDVAYINPRQTLGTNILGTVHILEAVRLLPRIKGVIVASSDKVYGKTKKETSETDPVSGNHPYEVSKAGADLTAQAYSKTYQVPVAITRFSNVYGPGDTNFDRIIPDIMRSIITGEKLILRSDGSFVRDYIYIKDVISGYLFLFDNFNKMKDQVFNFSSNDSYSVLALIKQIEKNIKRKISYAIANTAVNEIPYQHLKITKIKKQGWSPKYNISSAILETYKWYKEYFFDLNK